MGIHSTLHTGRGRWLATHQPDNPVAFFDRQALARAAATFRTGFPGLVSYAVKANPDPLLLRALAAAGIAAFDVASPREMALVRDYVPGGVLHYHNPVRSTVEVEAGQAAGVTSWSVDRMSELDKLRGLPKGTEIAVRLALPVPGAAYDFGTKFGASPADAVALLRKVTAMGFGPSMTFHPGTQCAAPKAWARYIAACAGIAGQAGVTLARLNVGGGFAAHRERAAPDLAGIFAAIDLATTRAFGRNRPALVCEPGRAMVAEAVSLALRVKALGPEAVVLNDGIYGALAEWRDLGPAARITVLGPDGALRRAPRNRRPVFGPTCDSLDRLPGQVPLPGDMTEGDYLLIDGMGAYGLGLATAFNGYGHYRHVTLEGPEHIGSGHPRRAV